jgi:uncharacterized protein YjgD (DUF1641 family)
MVNIKGALKLFSVLKSSSNIGPLPSLTYYIEKKAVNHNFRSSVVSELVDRVMINVSDMYIHMYKYEHK